MKHGFSTLVTVLFLLGSTILWADNQENARPPFQTSSGTHPADHGELGSGARPALPGNRAEGNFKERQENFKERHEAQREMQI